MYNRDSDHDKCLHRALTITTNQKGFWMLVSAKCCFRNLIFECYHVKSFIKHVAAWVL